MNEIKVKCPAKINLTLEVLNRREDGFHNIKSVMQLISLYDYLTIKLSEHNGMLIELAGTSGEIPYNEKNLVYKAAELYFKKAGLNNIKAEIYIEKNIPISAGLAGGSTDAAGTVWGLNYLLHRLSDTDLNELCASLGSDLNVCLHGGCVLAQSRGETVQNIQFKRYPVTLIKPKMLGISAGYAYKRYDENPSNIKKDNSEKLIEALNKNLDITPFLYNDLEYAIFNDFPELQEIKSVYPQAIMSGSGSTYFMLEDAAESKLDENYQYISGLEFIQTGVQIA